MKLKLKKYSKKYIEYFQKEKKFLSKFGNFEIHHIGSTAIPNMIGKGEIDILVITKNNQERKRLIKKLIEKDYISTKIKDKDRIFLYKKEKVIYNLHIIKSYKKAREQIKFRDYLIKNPEEAKKYLNIRIPLVCDEWFNLSRGILTVLKNQYAITTCHGSLTYGF